VLLLLLRSLGNARRLLAISVVLTAAYSIGLFVQWGRHVADATTLEFASLNFSMMFAGTLYRMIFVEGGSDPWTPCDGRSARSCRGICSCCRSPPSRPSASEGNSTVPYALGLLLFIAGTSILRFARVCSAGSAASVIRSICSTRWCS
jgi:hypothetical protein